MILIGNAGQNAEVRVHTERQPGGEFLHGGDRVFPERQRAAPGEGSVDTLLSYVEHDFPFETGCLLVSRRHSTHRGGQLTANDLRE